MNKSIFFLIGFLIVFPTYSQVFWTEDFGTGCSQGQSANGFVSANGTWTVTNTGTNDPYANLWFVSAMEAGMGSGNCGDGCGNNASLTNRTLHVGNAAVTSFSIPADLGATYNAGGFCSNFSICVITDKRVESPTINCTGQSNITLSFEYMEEGEGTEDDASLWYFDGTNWTQISSLPKSNNASCNPQGKWTAFTITLPASANNNPNVKIGFRWVNDDDGNGADPSFAVDNITLSSAAPSGPTAIINASQTSICAGQCITFADASTGNPTSWNWTFNGGTPSSSTLQNPGSVCFNSPGTYNVTLQVSDGTNTDDTTIVITVNSCAGPTAIINASQTSICAGQCITFADASTGNPTSWNWTFNGGTPSSSTQQNPGSVCFNSPGTYNVTLQVSDGSNTDDTTIVITVNNCSSGPVANFSASQTTICASTCINFTDQSTGNPTSWQWLFPGGTPSSSTAQNPASICYYTPGSYDVTLIVSDGTNYDTLTLVNYIQVNDCRPQPNFSADKNYICKDSCINFTDLSTNNPTGWQWLFPGATPNVSTSQNPTNICYNDTGYFPVTLIATNSYGSDTLTIDSFIYVSACKPPIANFEIPKVCFYNGCVKFVSTSANQPTGWLWVFQGANPDTFTTPVADSPCWLNDTTGTFTIKLFVSNSFGVDSMIKTITIDTLPTVKGFSDTTIYAGATNPVNLYAVADFQGGQYFWSPKDLVDCYYCRSVYTQPEDTTMYIVKYINPYYCEAYDTVWVYVVKSYAIGVPSAFSPNGDGNNDVLYVRGYGITSMNFKIFNRYGQKIFESSNQEYGWDGTVNGKPEDPGVFVWMLDARTADGKRHVLKGNVTLIR